MSILIMAVGSLLAAIDAQATSDTSISSLQTKVAHAQAQVDAAKNAFNAARDKALPGMSSADQAQWRDAETKFENLESSAAGSHGISAQKEAVEKIEEHGMKPDDRDRLDDARDKLAAAYTALNVAKAHAAERGVRNPNDDSSQANQPENHTQNGAGFSVRSERDAENHPPLPSSN
jgi:hypothetical protein